jgi:spore coat protein U-like protein
MMINLAKINFCEGRGVFVIINLIFGLIYYGLFPNFATANCIGLYSITPVSFGTYNPSSGINLTSIGNININNFTNCINILQPANTNFTVKFSTGLSGNYSSRKMINPLFPMTPLQYNLYTNSGNGATIWGDGTGGSGSITQTGASNINIPIYGVVPAGQNPGIGSYSDSIAATIEFN